MQAGDNEHESLEEAIDQQESHLNTVVLFFNVEGNCAVYDQNEREYYLDKQQTAVQCLPAGLAGFGKGVARGQLVLIAREFDIDSEPLVADDTEHDEEDAVVEGD